MLALLGVEHREQSLPIEPLEKTKVPQPLIDLIIGCTAKEPNQRPQDGSELQQALDDTQCEVNLGRSQLLLQTVVNRRRKDSFLTEERDRRFGRKVLIGIAILFPLLLFIDHNQRERIAMDLSRIEAQTQLPTAKLRDLLQFGSYDLKSIDALLNIKETEGDWHTKVFLAGGINLNTRLDRESQDTVLHRLIHESNYKTDALIKASKISGTINETNSAGDTPLMRAAKLGNVHNVSSLLLPRISLIPKRKTKGLKRPNGSALIGIIEKNGAPRKYIALYLPGADRSITDKKLTVYDHAILHNRVNELL
jgi:hypothetical protein